MSNAPIANEIRNLMLKGIGAAEAMNKVCGAGSFNKFAKEVYDSCRVKTA